MPRHEFRTIEDFVIWLEKSCEYNEQKADEVLRDKELRTAYIHAAFAYQHIAEIVRTSNIGIIFPYSEEDCPGHVSASQKICCNCGIHIDSLRPD